LNTLLATDFITHLRSRHPAVVPVKISDIRIEVITDSQFDIKDKEKTIKQPVGAGTATYSNTANKKITVIDYENFLDFQPDAVIKKLKLKKPDFIVYDMHGKSHFIVNELSQGNPKNKRTEALQQMHSAILHFDKIPGIKSFVNQFTEKWCVFSNREPPITTPGGMADAFINTNKYLTKPIKGNFQPIAKLGYTLIETTKVDI
jgi:hypothetical protein